MTCSCFDILSTIPPRSRCDEPISCIIGRLFVVVYPLFSLGWELLFRRFVVSKMKVKPSKQTRPLPTMNRGSPMSNADKDDLWKTLIAGIFLWVLLINK